ncbi:MAG: crotonase/enoyl-CoA hydratase family protein [Actinomycetota bacterium]|nr:crotonase/enoyl-CoA hydratase family protein [Pseudonocardiales bacterium]MDQ2708833.1 crotonase/enoyl-CoA hydratase family protein [Actinomycetota bacterium]
MSTTSETVSTTGDTVRAEITDGVADVRLNRPEKLNALNQDMFSDLLEMGLTIRRRSELRAVVLSGAGRGFCAGLDYAMFSAMAAGEPISREPRRTDLLDPDDQLLELGRGQRATLVWGTVPVPVIAAVHGPAFGGGFQLMLPADLRLIAPDAILSVAEVRWGLIPDMAGTQLLPRLVGMDVAKELTFTGRVVTGEEAGQIRLASRVVDDPRTEALELAHEIAARNPDAVRAAKALLDDSWHLPIGDGLAAERAAINNLIGSPNQVEAVRARLEQRPAVFAGPD